MDLKLRIKFSNLLADKIGKEIIIDTGEKYTILNLNQFIEVIDKQPWASEVLKNKHIKNPIILIIDNQLIQKSNNNEELIIKEDSDITFQIMFAGG